jgi:hypothetical protein
VLEDDESLELSPLLDEADEDEDEDEDDVELSSCTCVVPVLALASVVLGDETPVTSLLELSDDDPRGSPPEGAHATIHAIATKIRPCSTNEGAHHRARRAAPSTAGMEPPHATLAAEVCLCLSEEMPMLICAERTFAACFASLVLVACGAVDPGPAVTQGGSSAEGTSGDESSDAGPSGTTNNTTGPSSETDPEPSSGETAEGSTGDTEGGNNTVEPSRYPLELVSPREAGTLPSTDEGTPAMPSGHRIFKAYPGLPYEVRAVVIGGAYPYRYSISDEPDGMTIDRDTGVIAWPAPSEGTVTPTITVVDGEGTEVSAPWTIEVGADGFRFVDANAGNDGNAGTQDAPWQTLAGVQANSTAGEIVYLRGGTYDTQNMPVDSEGTTWARVEFGGQVHSVQWLAYPGEAPVIDNGYSLGAENSRFIRFSGSETHPVYLDGLEITNAWDKGIQFGSGTDYAVFWRLDIHGVAEAIDGSNSAGIMTLASYGDPSWYVAYQDSDFHDNAPGGIKQYSHRKLLWEDLMFRASGGGPDLKSSVPRFEVRRCTFADNGAHHGGVEGTDSYCGLFGNMAGDDGPNEQATGEIRYNLMLCGDAPNMWAMDVNQDGMAGEIHLYRNTFVGTVRVRNTDSVDGPFNFEHNVIVNSNEGTDHVTFESVEDPTRVTFSENISGTPADAIVDADGELQGAYVEHVGSRGHVMP